LSISIVLLVINLIPCIQGYKRLASVFYLTQKCLAVIVLEKVKNPLYICPFLFLAHLTQYVMFFCFVILGGCVRSVSCVECCQSFWIVHLWLPLRFSLTLTLIHGMCYLIWGILQKWYGIYC